MFVSTQQEKLILSKRFWSRPWLVVSKTANLHQLSTALSRYLCNRYGLKELIFNVFEIFSLSMTTLSVVIAMHFHASLLTTCCINKHVVVLPSVPVTHMTNNFCAGFQLICAAIFALSACRMVNTSVLRTYGYRYSRKINFFISDNIHISYIFCVQNSRRPSDNIYICDILKSCKDMAQS